MRFYTLIFWLLLPLAAFGASPTTNPPVQQSGVITPGHPAMFVTNGIIGDAGGARTGNLTALGLQGTGLPVCINDVRPGTVGGWHQLCLGANVSGAGALISYQAYGGATPLPLLCNVNGTQGSCGSGGGGGTTPGGATTDVQSNQGNAFYGDSGFTYNFSTRSVGIAGGLTVGAGLTFNGLTTGTQVSCLGLSSGNTLVLHNGACGSGGGGSTPGGATTQIQYNNALAFAGDPTFTFNNTTKLVSATALTLSGSLIVGGSATFPGAAIGTQVSCMGLNSANVLVLSAAACGSGGGGSGTVTSVATGQGLTGGPITSTGTINLNAPDNTHTSGSYTIAATDMAGQVNFNGPALTVVIPPISSTVLALGMTVSICNYSATSSLTISSTPTINGYSASSLPPETGGQGACLALTSNGASLDAIPVVPGGSYAAGTGLTLTGNTFSVTPGGTTTDVQSNQGGALYGDSGFTYNSATQGVTVGGGLTVAGNGGTNALLVLKPASAATEGLILTAPITSGAPFKFSTVNSGGFDFAGQTEIVRAFTYSGTTSFAQQGLFVDLVPSGTSADASQYSLNEIETFPSLVSSKPFFTLSVISVTGTGFYGQSSPLFVAQSTPSAFGTLAAWAATTSYTTLGQEVSNGTNIYALVTVGTSAGSGGPTGTGANITDGSAAWRYVDIIGNGLYFVGIQAQENMSRNMGGTSSGAIGNAFAANFVCGQTTAVTFEAGCVVEELDDFNRGTSGRRVTQQLVREGPAAINIGGTLPIDAIVSMSDSDNLGPAPVGYAIGQYQALFNPISATGYFDQVQSTNGAVPHMAAFIDANQAVFDGVPATGISATFIGWANSALLGNGDIQVGYSLIHQGTNGPVWDLSYQAPTAAVCHSGSLGSGYTPSGVELVQDASGNVWKLTATSGGACASLALQTSGQAVYAKGTPCASNCTLQSLTASTNSGATGFKTAGSGATADITWAAASAPVITLGGTAKVNIVGGLEIGGVVAGPLTASAVTANATVGTLPATAKLRAIYLQETAGHAVTGGINIGTSSGGAQVVSAAGMLASGKTTINPGSLLEQQIGGSTLYISAGSAWNSASVNIQVEYDAN